MPHHLTDARDRRRVRLLAAAIALYYAVLGLVILDPESVYSGDIGVQYVQAQSLLDHRFRSLDLDYPGEFLDRDRRFIPLREPFVIKTGGETQSIFPPASALVQAVGVQVWGLRGMITISLLCAWATLLFAARLAPPAARTWVLVALGFASPLWFYAVSGWHHAAGMAFATAAFVFAFTSGSPLGPWLAGLSLGAGASLRDEVILLAPGVALAIWLRERSSDPERAMRVEALRPILQIAAGAAAALLTIAAIDIVWFDRPAAAHLRHAVHFLQKALRTTRAVNRDVPVLEPMTIQQRHETVIEYWLFGYGNDALLAAYVAGLLVAVFASWKLRSRIGIIVWLAAVLWLVAQDFHELITAPKWLAGLYRVAPYLVFAVLPSPAPQSEDPWSRRLWIVALASTAAYLILAFAGVDTTGGKGLGPRLLLPLLPLLTVAAVIRIRGYLGSDAKGDRAIGGIGVVLAAMTLVMHVWGTTYAYYMRNRDDASAIAAVASSRERIVVAADRHTALLLFPLYYRKIILLVESQYATDVLGEMMARERLPGAILVSREAGRDYVVPGYRATKTENVGRMSITHWVR
jgi:hypothetical protein